MCCDVSECDSGDSRGDRGWCDDGDGNYSDVTVVVAMVSVIAMVSGNGVGSMAIGIPSATG